MATEETRNSYVPGPTPAITAHAFDVAIFGDLEVPSPKQFSVGTLLYKKPESSKGCAVNCVLENNEVCMWKLRFESECLLFSTSD